MLRQNSGKWDETQNIKGEKGSSLCVARQLFEERKEQERCEPMQWQHWCWHSLYNIQLLYHWVGEGMAYATLSTHLLQPWKPITDLVQSKLAVDFFFPHNGSLTCNIIRNTLGYHLIFLQCDHLRKYVGMWQAQAWLVPLCLDESHSHPISLLIKRSCHWWCPPHFMLDKLILCFFDITKGIPPRDVYMLHVYYICKNGLFLPCKTHWIHRKGIRHFRVMVHCTNSFGTIGNTFTCKQLFVDSGSLYHHFHCA